MHIKCIKHFETFNAFMEIFYVDMIGAVSLLTWRNVRLDSRVVQRFLKMGVQFCRKKFLTPTFCFHGDMKQNIAQFSLLQLWSLNAYVH